MYGTELFDVAFATVVAVPPKLTISWKIGALVLKPLGVPSVSLVVVPFLRVMSGLACKPVNP
jgi:hypothetical protein